jgi:hypothetical protein
VDRYLGLQPTATIDDWIAEVVTKPLEAEDERWRRFEIARKTGTSPSLPLAGYAGDYACDLYGTATVRPEGAGLVLELGPNFHIPLAHWLIRGTYLPMSRSRHFGACKRPRISGNEIGRRLAGA